MLKVCNYFISWSKYGEIGINVILVIDVSNLATSQAKPHGPQMFQESQ